MAEAEPSQDSSCSLALGSDVTFDIVCNPCDNDGDLQEAQEYCLECKEYLCEVCLKCHKKMSTTKNHTLIDKDKGNVNMAGKQGTSTASDKCTQPCQFHKDEMIKYYCPAHKVLICGVCMFHNHDTCKGKLYIPDEAKNIANSKDFIDFQSLLERLKKKSDNVLNSSHANIKSTSDYKGKVLKDIETFRQDVNERLDALKNVVWQTEDIERDESLMNSVADQTRQVQAELKRISSEFNELLSKRQYCKMFIEMKNTESTLARIQKQLEKVEPSCVTALRFNPNESLERLVRKRDALGNLLVKNPKDANAVYVGDINIKSKYNRDSKACNVVGATLLCKNKLAIVDWVNKSVKLIDAGHEEMPVRSEFKPESSPFAVARIPAGRIAVTLPNAKKILLMLCDDVITLEPDEYIPVDKRCKYIAYIDDTLVVSFTDNPPEVRLLGMTGETLKTFPTSSQGDRLFSCAPFLRVSSLTRAIYASDWDNDRVTMLDLDGNIIAAYKDKELKNPAGSMVDDTGLVYVCGVNSNNIHLLTPYCDKVKILLTEKDGIDGPRCVCFCRETRRLYIAMDNSNCVKVYQLS